MPDGLSEQTRQLLTRDKWIRPSNCATRIQVYFRLCSLHGIAEIEFGWNAVEKAVEDALAEQSARLYRKIEYLSVIGNIAPMVGLLGTVVGMIMAFQEVAASQATAGGTATGRGHLPGTGHDRRRVDSGYSLDRSVCDLSKSGRSTGC